MSDTFDFKKEYRDLYLPPEKPVIIDVPEITCIAVDGSGNPNTSAAYKNAMEVLYGLSYSIKMSKMNGTQPDGYFDYVVPPLEGFWSHYDGCRVTDKDKFVWTSFIRQPEFVTEDVFERAKEVLVKKKPDVDLSTTKFMTFTEGLCVQIMHTGPYDTEPEDIRRMDDFAAASGYRINITETRRHHEIYLGDPRKTAPEKLRTVIRHPVSVL
ncbi:MAG: GyrI-like domain-containing protein [Treponema sp.]|jgi:hypothetical protein|nr:GyrI-like domain-containing protein [Treponema sp.]